MTLEKSDGKIVLVANFILYALGSQSTSRNLTTIHTTRPPVCATNSESRTFWSSGVWAEFVCWHYWYSESHCYVLRVSDVETTADEIRSKAGALQLSWRNLFETKPCLPLEGS